MKHISLLLNAGFAHLLGMIIGFSFSLACARLMPAADFGELRYAMTWLPLLTVFSLPGFDSIILRNTSARISPPLLRILLLRMLGGAIGAATLVALLFLGYLPQHQPALFFFICMAIALPLFEVGTGYKNYLISTRLRKKGLRLFAQARILTLALLLLTYAIIYSDLINADWVFPAYLAALIIPTFSICLYLALKQDKRGRILRGRLAHGHEALMTSAAGLVGTLAFSLDKLMVRHDLGAEELAYYSILIMIPQEMARLIDAIFPLFYRRLFLTRQAGPRVPLLLILGILLVLYAVYVGGFYTISPLLFGKFYTYPVPLVMTAALLAATGAVEYYANHKIFAILGGRMLALYMALGAALCYSLYTLVLPLAGLIGVMAALMLKHLLLSSIFITLCNRKVSSHVQAHTP